ncbi:MAG: PKD domain-containing protein, partial [Solirubrobacterales bacterium]|nr:PKD domain-containing protein [Solirubrobacterales bacterium]
MRLRAPLGAALAVLLLAASPAGAADQVTADPDDAYASGSQGQSDLRAVEWHTSGTEVTAVMRVEYSSNFVAFAFLDVDRNGRADYALSVDGGSASNTFDAKLRPVGPSTTTCQLYDAGVAPTVSQQPSLTKDADGFLVLSVTFPTSAIGGAGAFTWAAFGLTLNGAGTRGWDYVPDASNPSLAGPQPGDRSCSVDQTPGAGVLLSLVSGVPFPTPAPANTPPTAAFSFAPVAPLSGDTVSFTSTSSDAQGPLVSQRWDLDADGQYDDATGASVDHAFARKGPNTVGVLVEDSGGAVATTSRTVPVGNRPPVVSVRLPEEPVYPGQPLRLESTSTDDGTIAAYAWDLDDDGAFDDAMGAIVTATYPRKGPHRVRLRATDDDGAVAEGEATAQVANRRPVAALRVTVSRGPSDDGFLLDASGSTDPDGDRLTYRFGDVRDRFTEPRDEPTYRYYPYSSQLGLRTVAVYVSDDTSTAVATAAIEVLLPHPPEPVITGPDQGMVVVNGTARLAGRIDRRDNLVGACVTVDVSAIPASCDDPAILTRAQNFRDVPVTLRPGVNRVTLWARDRFGQVSSAVTEIEAASATSGLDLRASMIEVTQGTQWETSSRLRDTTPGAARLADYTGVRLARGGPTFARVFANVRSLARGGQLPRGVT